MYPNVIFEKDDVRSEQNNEFFFLSDRPLIYRRSVIRRVSKACLKFIEIYDYEHTSCFTGVYILALTSLPGRARFFTLSV